MEDCEARRDCTVKRREDMLSEKMSRMYQRYRGKWSWAVERDVCYEEEN